MIKDEQVPPEVVEKVIDAMSDCGSEAIGSCMALAAITAAINAWPGAAVCHYTIGNDEGYEMVLPLPFPQERGDE